jgi:hypothetical protein
MASNIDEAHRVAMAYLAEKYADDPTDLLYEWPKAGLTVLREETVETWYGWVLTVQSEVYKRTRHPRDMVYGLGPLVVLKDSGEVRQLRSGNWEVILAEFERSLRGREDIKKWHQ